MRRNRSHAFTLLEIMLTLIVLSLAVAGVLRLYAYGTVKAATQKTAESESYLVDAVRGEFAAASSYTGVNQSDVVNSGAQGILTAGNKPVDAWGNALTIAPATILSTDDAFSVTFPAMTRAKCIALVPALMGASYQVLDASGQNFQAPGGGKAIDGGTIASACSNAAYTAGTGALTFVYYAQPKAGQIAAAAPTCSISCVPQTQTQTITCAGALVGHITESRTGTCTGAPCPSLSWSPWTTTASSCAVAPTAPAAPTTPATPAPTCSASTAYRAQPCASGMVGRIWQEQATTCVGGTPIVGAWSTISNNCTTPGSDPTKSTGCVAHVVNGTQACPAGEGGEIITSQSWTCDSAGNPVAGTIVQTSDTCQTSCALTGTCCTVGSQSGPQQTTNCAPGQYGGPLIANTTEYSTCASASASPVWGSPQVTSTSGSCAACPAPTTSSSVASTTQPASAACPAGQTGSDTWSEVYNVTTTTTTAYNCASAPTTLPAPTMTTSTSTADTGTRQGEVNTCTAATPVPGATQIAGAMWGVNIDVSETTGATYFEIGASCMSNATPLPTGPFANTIQQVPVAGLPSTSTTPNSLDTFAPAYRIGAIGETTSVPGVAEVTAMYAALPQSSCFVTVNTTNIWGQPVSENVSQPVSVYVRACNSSGCGAWTSGFVTFCSWNQC
jgi:type II secretory pathway pseudopilin PulG